MQKYPSLPKVRHQIVNTIEVSPPPPTNGGAEHQSIHLGLLTF